MGNQQVNATPSDYERGIQDERHRWEQLCDSIKKNKRFAFSQQGELVVVDKTIDELLRCRNAQ